MAERSDFLPNAFYDLIVFGSSTILFAIGFTIGFGWWDLSRVSQLKTFDVVLLFAALMFFGYEYGRLAEAWSSLIVQAPLKFLNRHMGRWGNADFCNDLSNAEIALNLCDVAGGRKGGKWTVYFHAMLVDPRIGSDLMKRYAWEK